MMTRFEQAFLQKTWKSLEEVLRDKASAGYVAHRAAQSLGMSASTLKRQPWTLKKDWR